MNLTRPISRSLRQFALAAMLCLTAQAATVPDPVAGEIFLGVRSSDSPNSYLLKLGLDTTFRNATAGTSFTVTGLGNVSADLVAEFGSNWHTRSDVTWGIFGTRTGVSPIVYGSRPRSNVNTVAPAWPSLSITARNSVDGLITSVLNEVGGYKGSTATVNSTKATFQANSAGDSSYAKQVGTSGTSDFGSLSQWTSIEGDFGNGAAGSVLDLFRFGSTGVSHVGSFSISSGGTITFTAVPAASNVDTDKDGFTDSQEALAGTDPNNPTSFFRASVTVTANGPRVQSQATVAANKSYVIEYSETLTGSWLTVFTHASGAGATPVDFVDTDPVRRARTKGFYRIKVSS